MTLSSPGVDLNGLEVASQYISAVLSGVFGGGFIAFGGGFGGVFVTFFRATGDGFGGFSGCLDPVKQHDYY